MSSGAPSNPFRPGPGTWPPVLAGRETERSRLQAIVGNLDAGRADPIHLLQAPRGMGKTVLLQAIENSAAGDAVIVRRSAARLPDPAALAGCLAPAPGRWRRVLDQVTAVGIPGFTLEREAPGPTTGLDALTLALHRHRNAPLLLLVDEAHTLRADMAHVLLNLFQDLAGRQPAALLLAGTPRLRPFLLRDEVNASFVERAPVTAPGPLSPTASREALDVPDWRHWRKEDAVLDEAAADSLGYPYFLQLWGHALWNAGEARQSLDRAALAEARARVDAVRADFYGARYDEFESSAREDGIPRDAMLASVRAIAGRVGAPGTAISTAELNRTLDEAGIDPDDAGLARGIIAGNGFLTQSGDDWRAAIPSLADYVQRHPR